jgi:hypothetical protein
VLANISKPLNVLQNRDMSFIWTDECQEALQRSRDDFIWGCSVKFFDTDLQSSKPSSSDLCCYTEAFSWVPLWTSERSWKKLLNSRTTSARNDLGSEWMRYYLFHIAITADIDHFFLSIWQSSTAFSRRRAASGEFLSPIPVKRVYRPWQQNIAGNALSRR